MSLNRHGPAEKPGPGIRAADDLRAFDRPPAGIGHNPPHIEEQKKKKSDGHETFPLETFYKRWNVEEPVS